MAGAVAIARNVIAAAIPSLVLADIYLNVYYRQFATGSCDFRHISFCTEDD